MMFAPARPVRVGAALVGVAGTLALAGCGAASTPAPVATQDDAGSAGSGSSGSGGSGGYADGTYTAEGSYSTPESVETITVTVTLADDVVTAVEVVGEPQARESEQYQGQFIGGISAEVVGKSIDEVSVTRVAGSSLTSGGFMQALEQIKADAAS